MNMEIRRVRISWGDAPGYRDVWALCSTTLAIRPLLPWEEWPRPPAHYTVFHLQQGGYAYAAVSKAEACQALAELEPLLPANLPFDTRLNTADLTPDTRQKIRAILDRQH